MFEITQYEKKLIYLLDSKFPEYYNNYKKYSLEKRTKIIDKLKTKFKSVDSLDKLTHEDIIILKTKKKSDSIQTIKHLSFDEWKSLFKAVKTNGSKRDIAIILLMYIFGMRASEVCNLTNDDIKMNNKSIFIEGLKKGLKHTYTFDDTVYNYLNDYISSRKDKYNLEDLSIPFFLRERTYKKLNRIEISRIYKKYGSIAKLKPDLMHPHSLRHTTACHLAIEGKQPFEVQKTLRHKSLSNTMVYFQLVGKELDNLLKSNTLTLTKNL